MILEQTEVMTTYNLGDGLLLRFATVDDVEALAHFNGRIHGNDGKFNPFVSQWTREFASPSHPTCGPNNVTIVEDTRTGHIVSSMCLIPQTWTYDGVPFEVGRPEAVGTDPAYRRRGLVRAQFDVLHAKSDAAGHLAQGITGIPWYYRQFGYEYAIDLDGGRWVYPALAPALKEGETEPYRLRPVTLDDLPCVMPLYDRQCTRSLIACPRSKAEWRRRLLNSGSDPTPYQSINIIETTDGQPRGYVTIALEMWGVQFRVQELNVIEGQSLRTVLPTFLRWVKPIAEAAASAQQRELRAIFFMFGASHPAFNAAPDLFHSIRAPYGWYMRVADVPKFLNHVAPVLERRLAQSALAGYSGELKVTEYVRGFKIVVEQGKVRSEAWQPDDGDASALFPPLTFLQMLFGRRSFEELDYMYPDCFANDEAEAVLKVLFPKKPSNVLPMG